MSIFAHRLLLSYFNPSSVFGVSLASTEFSSVPNGLSRAAKWTQSREHVSSEVWFKMVEQFDLEASLSKDSFLSRDLPLRPRLGLRILIEPHAICMDEEIGQTAEGRRGEEGNKENLKLEICAEEVWAWRALRLRSLQLTCTPSAPLAGKKRSKPSRGLISRSYSSDLRAHLTHFSAQEVLRGSARPAQAYAGRKEACFPLLFFLRVLKTFQSY